MADKPAEQPKKGVVYEFENRTREQWVLDIGATHPDDPPKLVVFGDMVNRIVVDESTRHPVYQRSPVVRLTAEEYAAMLPGSRKMLEKLVADHKIDRRELAA
jgi:hypothetical protein